MVAIGASAGGLEALRDLLAALGDPGSFAIVFVQHLNPGGDALLPDLLAAATPLSVRIIDHGTPLEPGNLFIAPPRSLVGLSAGAFTLSPIKDSREPSPSIDHFFHALAAAESVEKVGVILSGAGTDGTLGLKSISDAGGMTAAQDPATAKFDSMPRSAATTGVADHVLPPPAIAAELIRYRQFIAAMGAGSSSELLDQEIAEAIPAMTDRLLEATGHNFQHYKVSTLRRRIRRRMQVLRLRQVGCYVDRLRSDRDEAYHLFRELLIGVTAFFRDAESFAALAAQVLPQIFQQRSGGDPVRIWIPGCATGEEAYTVAMLCREQIDGLTNEAVSPGGPAADYPFQIFATDIDQRALDAARCGVYPAGIAADLSPERLQRFFVKSGKHYHVTQELRESVLFSAHNLISDPPFSRQDLICCRNLLIYLGPHLQKKLIPLFHYALRPGGFLMLGLSESISAHGDLFRSIDGKHRLSQRKGTGVGRTAPLRISDSSPAGHQRSPAATVPVTRHDAVEVMQRIVLDEFAPRSAVVDKDGRIICTSAELQKYISTGEGVYQNNIFKLARRGLRIGLRAALGEAKKYARRVTHQNLSVESEQGKQPVMLTVQPMVGLGDDGELFLIVFHDIGLPLSTSHDRDLQVHTGRDADADVMIEHLERELSTTRDDLDQTLQEMEVANEELKSSNEELLSMNEELQSANEELVTSKEEIQASSEALARAHADLGNLLRSTQIATIFLDDEYRIRSFTPAATRIYDLIQTDVGRPLSRFVPLADEMPPLPPHERIRDDRPVIDLIRASDGRWYSRRVLPYHNGSGQRDGLVVTFIDVTESKDNQELFQLLVDVSAQIVWLTDAAGEVQQDSPSWRAFTGQTFDQWRGTGWLAAIHPDDRQPTLQRWQSAVHSGEPLELEYRLRHHSGEYRWTQVRAVPQLDHHGAVRRWVGMNTDITERKQGELELADREAHLRGVIDNMLGFVGILDTQGNLLEANATALQAGGLSRSDVIGKKFWDCHWWSYSADVAAELQAAFQRALRGETVRYDVKVRMANDSRMAIDFMLVPVRDGEGKITHVIPSGIDIQARLASEQRSAMALRAGGMAAWEWSATGSQWDPALYELLGISQDLEASPEVFFQHVHPEDRRKIKADWGRAVRGEDQYRSEFRIVRPDGEIRWLAGVGDVVRDDSGQVARIYGLNWDITREKEVQRRIVASEERLRLALSAAELKLWQWDVNADRFYLSGELGEQIGLLPVEPLGGLTKFLECVHPDDRAGVEQRLRESLQEGTPYRCEYRIRRSTSSYRWVMALAHLSVRDTDSPAQMIGVELDITTNKRREREISLGAQRLSMAARAAGFGMLHVDLRRDVVTFSPELLEIVGYPVDTDFGLKPGDLPPFVHPADAQRCHAYYNEVQLASDQPTPPLEHRIVRADGEIRWVRLQTQTLFSGSTAEHRQPTQIIGTLLDISNQHAYEQSLQAARRQAEAANQSKSEFLANMSHEIRTPMTAILGYTDLVAERVEDEQALEHLDTIRRNSQFLVDIINDILDLSKIEAGKLEVYREWFNPVQLVEEVRSIMAVRASEADLQFDVRYQGRLPARVNSDPKRLKQILINLVGNAIKFTSQGSVSVIVSCVPVSQGGHGKLRFAIVDTGIGMTAEQQRRIFEAFSQADSSVSRRYGGTGLGLVITRRLTAMLGGEIELVSEPNRGSTFTVSIDAGDLRDVELVQPQSVAGVTMADPSADPATLNCRVLVVDDRREIRFLSKQLLTRAGAEVSEAEDGLVAVEQVTQALSAGQPPDLILLDMQMPNLDGYQTARRLRKLNFQQPIIALTADAMQGDMRRCLRAGCNDYLSKPIDARQLIEMVRRFTAPD